MLFLFVVIMIIVLEYQIKNYIENRIEEGESRPLFHGKIQLKKYHNYGAFLNILENKQKFLHLFSCLLTVFTALFFLLTLFQKGNSILRFGLAFLLGGAFSNTYDRLKRTYVVDYFSFNTPFKALNRIVFNISDFCILVGSLILVICHVRK